MTTPAIEPKPRRIFTPIKLVLAILAIGAITAAVFFRGWIVGPRTASLDEGAGPPPSDVAPPFPAAKDPAQLKRLTLPPGNACELLNPVELEALYGVSFSSSPEANGCAYNAGDVQVRVELVEASHSDAYAAEAKQWPAYGEVIYEPVYALFLLDAERSALVVDSVDRTLILRAQDSRLDRLDHLERLKGLVVRIAD